MKVNAPEWLSVVVTLLVLALLLAAGVIAVLRRRRVKAPPADGWLTDEMIRQIIRNGSLTGEQVPEEALNLEEIAREEERFWSERWDESEPYWE